MNALQDVDNEVKFTKTFAEDSSETCSGDTCSVDDDDTISLCSWTTDQGEWRCGDQDMSSCVIPYSDHFMMGAIPLGPPRDLHIHNPSVPLWYAPAFIPMTAVCIALVPEEVIPERGGRDAVASGSEEKAHCKKPSSSSLEGRRKGKTQMTVANVAKQERLDATKEPSYEIAERTTIFLRNLSVESTRDSLVQLLHDEGFGAAYDFLYCPIDFQTKAGLGYAVVNMVSHSEALRAQEHLTGFTKWPVSRSKSLEASWNEPLQGLTAHIERYRNSPLMHSSIPDSYRPALFHSGVRIDFPSPTAKIRAPRIRHPKADVTTKK
jgi:hypothetical protein